jgi:hypothetical protein
MYALTCHRLLSLRTVLRTPGRLGKRRRGKAYVEHCDRALAGVTIEIAMQGSP